MGCRCTPAGLIHFTVHEFYKSNSVELSNGKKTVGARPGGGSGARGEKLVKFALRPTVLTCQALGRF